MRFACERPWQPHSYGNRYTAHITSHRECKDDAEEEEGEEEEEEEE